MSSQGTDIGCASIPVQDLPVLAGLRGCAAIRVSVVGERAWICWEPGSEAVQQVVLERLLPLPGVEVFMRRGGSWYRPGAHLPAFAVPAGVGSEGIPLERVVLPRPMTAQRPADAAPIRIPLRLVRDERGQPRSASAELCRLDRLAGWADRASAPRLAALRAAWTGGNRPDRGDWDVLVLGGPGTLPELADGRRFWGGDVLVPMGFRPDPELPEPALCRAAGAGPNDLVVLEGAGYEVIPRAAFRPLSRAGIRLAWGTIAPDRVAAAGGRRP